MTKELIKDRIDVLLEKAHEGDSSAQLTLATYFKDGKLVEISLDQAKYWAFKAVSNGSTVAESFYNSLYK